MARIFYHLLASFIIASATSFAGSATEAQDLSQNPAKDQEQLASDPIHQVAQSAVWRQIIGYRRARHWFEQGHSAVKTETFFFHPNGRKNPEAELRATLAAMRQPFQGDLDTHALCRFPARARVLAELGDLDVAKLQKCEKLAEWRGGDRYTGASLILASGYLSNPASFYGHLLLKFNSESSEKINGTLLDTTINYGAIYPPGENPVLYVLKGIGGGYQSRFTNLQYYNHRHNYADEQLRDVWEYELNITADQTALLVDHAFELMQVSHNYYFFLQNCAYRMAELVEVVMDANLLEANKVWIAPVDVFERLAAKGVGQPQSFVRRVIRVPSQQNRFREDFARLPKPIRRSIRDLLNKDTETAAVDAFEAEFDAILSRLQPREGALLVEAVISYLEFLKVSDKIDEGRYASRRKAMLLARLKLPPAQALSGLEGDARFQAVEAPHQGNPTSLLQINPIYHDDLGSGLEVRVRPVHSDFFSLEPGTLPYSELSLFDTRLLWRDDRLTLRSMDIARITNLKPSVTGVKGDAGASWRIRFGLQSRDLGCDSCLNGVVAGGVGHAVKLGQHALVYGLMGGQVLVGDNAGSELQASATTGLLLDMGQAFRLGVEAGVLQEIDANQDFAPFIGATVRFAVSRRLDFRARARWQESLAQGSSAEFGLSLSYFW